MSQQGHSNLDNFLVTSKVMTQVADDGESLQVLGSSPSKWCGWKIGQGKTYLLLNNPTKL